MPEFTAEQVLALAPDAASAKAGSGLAKPGNWLRPGRNARAAWGECQGSGKDPYRAQADLAGPAFHCSCPSRKFPCKHGLGLLLLLTAKPEGFPAGDPPPWVVEWLAKRDATTEKKAAKAEASDDPEAVARREADRGKRALRREDRVQTGLADLQTWLGDTIRQGLGHAQQRPSSSWDGIAARMIDAQAPGVARVLRAMPGIIASGEGWAELALDTLSRLQLLLLAYARLPELPEPLQQDVRSAIGWNIAQEDLSALPAVRDRWQVLAQQVEEEERLRVQRTWLLGEVTGHSALCLAFAAVGQPLDVSLIPGVTIDAELVFHPSAAPLRASVRSRHGEPTALRTPGAQSDFGAALEANARWLAGNPWLERVPFCVANCTVVRGTQGWFLHDVNGSVVPLSRHFPEAWTLQAVAGGHGVTVFGEWDGHALRVLSAFAEGRFVPLSGVAA